MKKKWILLLGLLLLGGLVWGGLRFQGMEVRAQDADPGSAKTGKGSSATSVGKPGGKPLPVVAVEKAVRTEMVRTLELTGSVTPTRMARIASPAEGPVAACESQHCMVREGDWVKKGQILLQIGRNKSAEAQLAAAQQTLEEQALDLQRLEQLVEAGAVPGAQLDGVRSRYENARAQLARTLESNEDYRVAAPWDGLVSRVHVTEGDYVAPRAVLIEMFDPGSLVIQFAVPEARSMEVQREMPVRIHLDAYRGKAFSGKIERVYPQLDSRTRTRLVEAALDASVSLVPGMFARVELILKRIPDALTIPSQAVRTEAGSEKTVFVVEEGRIVSRSIQTGMEEGGRVQVLSGMEPGESVVTAGSETLAEGASVRIVSGGNP